MSRDKQISEIEKMASEIDRILCEAEMRAPYPPLHPSIVRAKALYNAGYRKSTDVAEEIFAEIEEKGKVDEPIVEYYILSYSELAELKKKYTESEKENG